jgi:trehalose 6-phosphate phosphatase
VDDPENARPFPGAGTLLAEAADFFAVVAVISGRPLAYLTSHLRNTGRTELFGLYGLERSSGSVGPAVEAWRQPVADVADKAEAGAPPGLFVERKGLTVTLHYRSAPETSAWAEAFAAAESRGSGLVAHAGKMSIELRPPVQTDKGTVLRELGAKVDAICFLGDDLGDVPAFAELARMREEGKTTLAVAVDGPETPREVTGAADLVVDGPDGVAEFLEALVRRT